VLYAKNSCPSQGTMDIFIEPVLPEPKLLILGASPVAVALAKLAPLMGFAVTVAAQTADLAKFEGALTKIEGVSAPGDFGANGFIVVSTQGAGDRAALKAAASTPARYRSFVGSRRKAETLRQDLAADGVAPEILSTVKAPAGLDLHAISAEEIALSILAEMVAVRRRSQIANPAIGGASHV
jgi:xanthine dehydrogenase accessory factor